MTENTTQPKHQKDRKSLMRFLHEKTVNRNFIIVMVILFLMVLSIVLWQLDIDWERQVEKYGYFGVFLLMFASSLTIFFPLPSEAVLAIAPNLMGLEAIGDISKLALVASIGAALGEMTAYFAGLWGSVLIMEKYKASYGKVDQWMKHYGGPAIFIFSFTPLPMDLVGIAAGSLRYPIWKFLFYCWAGRLARALLIVHLGKVGWEIFF